MTYYDRPDSQTRSGSTAQVPIATGTLNITKDNGDQITFRTNEHWYTEGPAPDPLQELTTLTEELGLYDTPTAGTFTVPNDNGDQVTLPYNATAKQIHEACKEAHA